ncbi:calcium-binding protein [Ancylobacter lacus]|uniref:calcium-binding protein n=1 Tax=Ancylobacter lacus TaxID=2579970 RepID=UPI001BD0FBCD|nr:calcium-binding protein [Ancylobacter lacus]MBS7540582.1 calcium-binding protein [Ancylobacter lacus]
MQFTRSGRFSRTSTTTNTTTNQTLSTYGFYGSSVIYTATDSDTTLTGSDANEAFIYDLTLSGSNALRFSGFTAFDAGAGDDIIDFTVRPANAGHEYATDATIYGGLGNDVIWTAGSHLAPVYGDNVTMAGTSASDLVQGGNDIIDASAATVGTAVIGDGFYLSWAKGGNDTLTGSASDDTLYGDGGRLAYTASSSAFGGDDVLRGGAGKDTLYGDGNLLGYGASSTAVGGNDTLYAGTGTEADMLYGDGSYLCNGTGSTATGGNDTLYGNDGGNPLYGDGGTLGFGRNATATGGNDTVYAGGGADTLFGDANAFGFSAGSTVKGGADTLYGEDGDDTIYGDGKACGNLANVVTATGGGDTLHGGAGADILVGDADSVTAKASLTCGNDRLDGGTGNDKLYGDVSGTITAGGVVTGGNDTFVFQPGSGADTIYDFGQVAGSSTGDDLIDVSAYGYTSFAGLSITGNGTAAVVVDFGGGNSVTVQNRANTALTLDASDFVFAA